MHEMVAIDTIGFEIVGGGGLLKPAPPDRKLSQIPRIG